MRKYIYITLILLVSCLSFFIISKDVYYMPIFAKHGDIVDQLDNVNIYFNDPKIKSNEAMVTPCGYRVGVKYQCVEFVKRYYFEHYNHKMPNIWGNARDFYNSKLKDGAFNKERGLLQYKNGSSTRPEKGDLLVYKNGKYGHVAIVSKVSDNSITIMHQNAGRYRPTRMKHSLKYKDGVWTVEKDALLGWLRVKS